MRSESEKVGFFIDAPSAAPDYYYLGVSMSIHARVGISPARPFTKVHLMMAQ
jgi:hypothetical protein